MKRKLLFAAALLAGAVGFNANAEDVTTNYIKNADFSKGTLAEVGICTYNYDMQNNGTTLYGMQPVRDWTAVYPWDPEAPGTTGSAAGQNAARAAGLFEAGSSVWIGGAGNVPPVTHSENGTGNLLGIMAVWSSECQYTQDVTLEAGAYAITFNIYNNGNAGNVNKNFFGFIADSGKEYLSDATTFETGAWKQQTVKFAVDAETAGKISIGLKVNNIGSGSAPRLFVDNVKIEEISYEDYLAEVKQSLSQTLDDLTPQGEGLFYYSATAVAKAKAAVQAAKTITEVEAVEMPTKELPKEGQKYIIANTTISDAALCVTTNKVSVEKEAWVYFTATGDGYAISNGNGEYIKKTADNDWTLSTDTKSSDAYVLTVNPVDNGYTLKGAKGIMGLDGSIVGSTVYANKEQTNHGVWTIEEVNVSDDLLGIYYIYNEKTGKFMSRGSWYGTRAMADEYGLPIQVDLASNTFDKYSLKGLDNNLFYGDDAWMYADCNGSRVRAYSIDKVDDKDGVYTITNTANNRYVYVNTVSTDAEEIYGIAGNATQGENYNDIEDCYWKLLTAEEYKEIQEAKTAAIAQTVAEKSGVAVEDLKNYAPIGASAVLSFANGKSQWNGNSPVSKNTKNGNVNTGTYGTEVYEGTRVFTQSVEDLEQGLYLVSVQGFYRGGSSASVSAAYEQGYDFVLSYLEANDATVRLANWAEEANGTYPSKTEEAEQLFNASKYIKSVVAYVGEDGKLDLTVMGPSFVGAGWLILNNVTYTKMEEPSVTVTKAGWATYVTPATVDFTGVEAYKAVKVNTEAEEAVVELVAVTEAPAGTPVIIKGVEGEETTYTLTVIDAAASVDGNLLEVAGKDGVTNADNAYVLADLDEGVGFYALADGYTLAEGKVYLKYVEGGNIKFIGFDGGNATGINGVENAAASVENAVIYNIAGQRVSNPTKGGIYIINGKKVLVK